MHEQVIAYLPLEERQIQLFCDKGVLNVPNYRWHKQRCAKGWSWDAGYIAHFWDEEVL